MKEPFRRCVHCRNRNVRENSWLILINMTFKKRANTAKRSHTQHGRVSDILQMSKRGKLIFRRLNLQSVALVIGDYLLML